MKYHCENLRYAHDSLQKAKHHAHEAKIHADRFPDLSMMHDSIYSNFLADAKEHLHLARKFRQKYRRS